MSRYKYLIMLLLLSPAKSLNLYSDINCSISSIPFFQNEIDPITKVLKKLTVKQIEKKFELSNKLAVLNHERFQNIGTNENIKNSRQAIFTFDGEVYSGFDAYSLDSKKFDFTQKTVRILSGLYGLLKPFDLIEPYRLEMGIDIAIGRKKNLYQYWSDSITNSLNNELSELNMDNLINLASIEYFKVIDRKKLNAQIIDIEFLEDDNSKLKNVSFYSKKARGLMARFIIDHKITKREDLKMFDSERYSFNSKLSMETKLVYTRNYKPLKAK